MALKKRSPTSTAPLDRLGRKQSGGSVPCVFIIAAAFEWSGARAEEARRFTTGACSLSLSLVLCPSAAIIPRHSRTLLPSVNCPFRLIGPHKISKAALNSLEFYGARAGAPSLFIGTLSRSLSLSRGPRPSERHGNPGPEFVVREERPLTGCKSPARRLEFRTRRAGDARKPEPLNGRSRRNVSSIVNEKRC